MISLLKQIVHKKTAAALCLTSVKNEDKLEFSKILEAVKVIVYDEWWQDRFYFLLLFSSRLWETRPYETILEKVSLLSRTKYHTLLVNKVVILCELCDWRILQVLKLLILLTFI